MYNSETNDPNCIPKTSLSGSQRLKKGGYPTRIRHPVVKRLVSLSTTYVQHPTHLSPTPPQKCRSKTAERTGKVISYRPIYTHPACRQCRKGMNPMSGGRVAQLARPDLGQVPSQQCMACMPDKGARLGSSSPHSGSTRLQQQLRSSCTIIASISAVFSDRSFPLDYHSRDYCSRSPSSMSSRGAGADEPGIGIAVGAQYSCRLVFDPLADLQGRTMTEDRGRAYQESKPVCHYRSIDPKVPATWPGPIETSPPCLPLPSSFDCFHLPSHVLPFVLPPRPAPTA